MHDSWSWFIARSCAATSCSVAQGGLAFSKTLQVPTPFAAADVISRDDAHKIEYHYTIVEASVSLSRAALFACKQPERTHQSKKCAEYRNEYCVQVAAVPEDPTAVAKAASDVDDIAWVPVDSLRQHHGEHHWLCTVCQVHRCLHMAMVQQSGCKVLQLC